MQPDPSAQDGVRSYVYCHDAPVDCADPSGLEGEPDQSAGADGAGVPGAIGAATGQAPAAPAGVQGTQLPLPGFDIGASDAVQEADVADPAGPQYNVKAFSLNLSRGWQQRLRNLVNAEDQIIYQLSDMDSATGEIKMILKLGRTTGRTITDRYQAYATVGQRLRLSLQIKAWVVEVPETSSLQRLEMAFRQDLLDAGETLPWDNTILPDANAPRLGRPGSGVPFVYLAKAARLGYTWDRDPQSPYFGMLLNSEKEPAPYAVDYYPYPLAR